MGKNQRLDNLNALKEFAYKFNETNLISSISWVEIPNYGVKICVIAKNRIVFFPNYKLQQTDIFEWRVFEFSDYESVDKFLYDISAYVSKKYLKLLAECVVS